MRVIAGTAGSIPLIAPKGYNTRPTIDKHKETLFNCLSDRLYNAVFLDLYSGSGAIGIEALSRGAKSAYFVENNKEALNCIRANLKKTRLSDKGIVIGKTVESFLVSGAPAADIIFMDPPFELRKEEEIIPVIIREKLLKEDGIIVCECLKDGDFSGLDNLGLEIFKEKDYKTCRHVFIRFKE